ncbi:unnamed protein product [Dracunculus medinensis]|uniref:WD repeat domain phosphoinositide-interacting protein 3 n=1 Tax=Dracunculus medinensis TaxID=318479 RepID=A0A0N4U587_DRAME|nr:unnamed protein product [Dracunculus medinensis]
MRASSRVLSIHFNQDFGCFACGLSTGLCIFNSDPLKQCHEEKFDGGIALIEMLFRCNYIIIVGGGDFPAFPTNLAVIWDIVDHKEITRIEMPNDVKGIRLRRDRIIIVLFSSIHIYSFTETPEKLHIYCSSTNPLGLCCLCPSSENSLLVFPAPSSSAEVACINLAVPNEPPTILKAHTRPLSAIALNSTGKQLATCSVKGTIIRIFDTQTKLLLHELRRGSSSANIFSLNFSFDSSMLCVSSNHTTVHLFSWKKPKKPKNLLDTLNLIGLSGEGSFSKFQLPFSMKSSDICICAFGPQSDSIIAISSDGSYCKFSFSFDGECTRQTSSLYLQINNH